MATIITREVGGTAKNSPLTNAELDNNFINLNDAIENLPTPAPATTSSAGLMSASDKAKLDGVEEGAQANTVASVAGKTGAVTLVTADVAGLDTALSAKANDSVTLTDAAASKTLPATSSTAITALLQTVRNCLKWLLAKTDELLLIPTGTANSLTLAEAGKSVAISAAKTIPTNASVAFPIGTCILLTCDSTARTITGPASNSLTLEGSGSAVTSFTLKANKSAVIRKTGTDAWRVYGDV